MLKSGNLFELIQQVKFADCDIKSKAVVFAFEWK